MVAVAVCEDRPRGKILPVEHRATLYIFMRFTGCVENTRYVRATF